MDRTDIDQLNRVIAAATVIRSSADQLLTIAMYLRDRASDIGDDDRAMLRRWLDQIDENVQHLKAEGNDKTPGLFSRAGAVNE